MCGRFTLTVPDHQALATALGVEMKTENTSLYRPRFNIAPSDRHWIVVDREILPAVWGVPNRFTGKDAFINARLETAAEKPTFREAFKKRRCAIPADGFYEWKSEAGKKAPYWFCGIDRQPFLFAGLFETDPVLSFTILTKAADPVVAPIHARMPVIFGRSQLDDWLSESRIAIEESGITLNCRPVSLRVNSPHNDDPTLLG